MQRTNQNLLERAIRQFGGLSQIYDLVGEPGLNKKYSGGRFQTLDDELTQGLGKKKDHSGGSKIKNWQNCLDAAIEREKYLTKELTKANKTREKEGSKLKKIRRELEEIDAESGQAFTELGEIGEEINELDALLDEATSTMLMEFLNPSRIFVGAWAKMAAHHRDHNDRKLPSDVGKAWLVGLAEEAKHCVCGVKLNNEMRDHIREHLENHLDGEKRIAVSSMQSAFATTPTANRAPLSASKARVEEYDRKLSEARTKKEQVYNKKALEEQKNRRDSLRKKEDESKMIFDDADAWIRILSETNLTWLRSMGRDRGMNQDETPTTQLGTISEIENLTILERVKMNLNTELNKAQGNIHLFNGLNQVRDVIGSSLTELSNEMRGEVSRQATKIWRTMPAAAAEGRLRISIESDGLSIYRGANTVGGVSGAQKVSACYSITKSIGDLGEISFPLVCDTPFAGFDTDMIPTWYKSITPSFEQVIALINTNEKRVLLETVWEPGDGDADYRASVMQLSEKSPDGGKQLQFTENRKVFDTLLSAMDHSGEGQ